jgi:hypothetical protein
MFILCPINSGVIWRWENILRHHSKTETKTTVLFYHGMVAVIKPSAVHQLIHLMYLFVLEVLYMALAQTNPEIATQFSKAHTLCHYEQDEAWSMLIYASELYTVHSNLIGVQSHRIYTIAKGGIVKLTKSSSRVTWARRRIN